MGLQWVSNPAATELEVLVMDWLAEAVFKSVLVDGDAMKMNEYLHRNGSGGGIIQDTAGAAILNIVCC